MIISRSPRNGVEIIADMEVMTHGWWRPSPGSVYPLLEEMVKEGSIKKREDSRYELAQPSDAIWSWHPPSSPRTPADVLREISGLTAYLEDIARSDPSALSTILTEVDPVADRLRRLKN